MVQTIFGGFLLDPSDEITRFWFNMESLIHRRYLPLTSFFAKTTANPLFTRFFAADDLFDKDGEIYVKCKKEERRLVQNELRRLVHKCDDALKHLRNDQVAWFHTKQLAWLRLHCKFLEDLWPYLGSYLLVWEEFLKLRMQVEKAYSDAVTDLVIFSLSSAEKRRISSNNSSRRISNSSTLRITPFAETTFVQHLRSFAKTPANSLFTRFAADDLSDEEEQRRLVQNELHRLVQMCNKGLTKLRGKDRVAVIHTEQLESLRDYCMFLEHGLWYHGYPMVREEFLDLRMKVEKAYSDAVTDLDIFHLSSAEKRRISINNCSRTISNSALRITPFAKTTLVPEHTEIDPQHLRKNDLASEVDSLEAIHMVNGSQGIDADGPMLCVNILDSGSPEHCTGDRSQLSDYHTEVQPDRYLRGAGGRLMRVHGTGSIRNENFQVKGVLYVPDLNNQPNINKTIFSVAKLNELGYSVLFNSDGSSSVIDNSKRTWNLKREIIGKARKEHGHFMLDYLRIPLNRDPVAMLEGPGLVKSLWDAYASLSVWRSITSRLSQRTTCAQRPPV